MRAARPSRNLKVRRPDHTVVVGLLLIVAVFAANVGSLKVPFLFDDEAGITNNPTIRNLADLHAVLNPPRDGSGVMGRPLVNLTLALNHAVGGESVFGYHLFNVVLHAFSASLLFGIGRRTLGGPVLSGRFGAAATAGAFALATLWALHPLQTESVTCVIQRTELLVGFFYLATIYCFIRSTETGSSRIWPAISIVACLAGMASKEVMVTAPLMVWLVDRTYFAGSFAAAWRARGRFYVGLGATWLLLFGLLAGSSGSRGAAAGFGLGVPWWSYALKQCEAHLLYLKLTLWPHPLVLDYGTATTLSPAAVAPKLAMLVLLATATVVSFWRWPTIGMLGAWFFIVLSPSSSVVPLITQTIAEHRMYLPLIAPIALAVLVVLSIAGRHSRWVAGALAIVFGVLTWHRNIDYRSERSIWQVTLAEQPDNPRVRMGLGIALVRSGEVATGIEHLTTAVRLKPDHAEAHYNLGLALFGTGRISDAVACYEESLRLRPDYADAHTNLGVAFFHAGRIADAAVHLEAAVKSRPLLGVAHSNLGGALARLNRLPEAIAHLETAIRLDPKNAEAHNSLGAVWQMLGNRIEARRNFEAALRIQPDFKMARDNLVQLESIAPQP